MEFETIWKVKRTNAKEEPAMPKLLLATANSHKVRELAEMLQNTDWEVLSLADFPDITIPPEDGATFQENALIKALSAAEQSGLLTLADDSGLTVDALDGAPGVHSARFAGEGHDDAANNAKLLRLLAEVPADRRGAAFVCVIALASPDGAFLTTQGECRGEIAHAPRGQNGFGYDPLFYLPELGRTMAELSEAEKNQISHRGRAMAKARKLLERLEK